MGRNQWRPPEPNSVPSSRTCLTKSDSRNDIPSGTVATRVRTIETPTSPSRSNTSKVDRNRGDSSIGFGRRRLTSRLAPPASRQATPVDGRDHIETSHSFLGYRTPRTNHGEGHASCVSEVGRMKCHPANGIRVKERGDARIVPHSSIYSQNTASRCNATVHSNRFHVTDASKSERVRKSPVKRRLSPSTSAVRFPWLREDRKNTSGSSFSGMKSDTLSSNASISTTSTMRRQSVRELFEDYSIKRPAGLASTTNTSNDLTLVNYMEDVCCHVCSFTNKHVQLMCLQCGHRFCPDCPAVPYKGCKVTATPEQRFDRSKQHSCHHQDQTGSDISGPVKFPSFDADMLKEQKKSLRSSTQSGGSTNSGTKRAENTLSRNNGEQSAISNGKVADDLRPANLSSDSSSRSRFSHGMTSNETIGSQISQCLRPVESRSGTSLQSQEKDTERMTNGNISDTRMGKGANPQAKISPGTSAGQSFEEDERSSVAHPYFSSPHSRSSRARSMALDEQSDASKISSTPDERISRKAQRSSEYVECHGYPRTGHGQCGSPTDTGVVGDCQHCIDDCECLACQSTLHAVRCCTHRDHPSISHSHRTSGIKSLRSGRLGTSTTSDESKPLSPFSSPSKAEQLESSKKKVYQSQADTVREETKRAQYTEPDFFRRNSLLSGVKKKNKKSTRTERPSDEPDRICGNVIDAVPAPAEIRRRQNAISVTVLSGKGQSRGRKKQTQRGSCTLSLAELRALEKELSKFRSSNSSSQATNSTSAIRRNEHANKKKSKQGVTLEASQPNQDNSKIKEIKRDQIDHNSDSPQCAHSSKPVASFMQDEKKSSLSLDDQSVTDTVPLPDKNGKQPKNRKYQSSPLASTTSVRDTAKSFKAGNEERKDQQVIMTNETVNSVQTDTEQGFKSDEDERLQRPFLGSYGTEILGITVIVHTNNRDDLVFKVDAALAESH